MASTHLLVSSSPTPAHHLQPPSFRQFAPQPSPLSRAIFRNNSLNAYSNQDLKLDDFGAQDTLADYDEDDEHDPDQLLEGDDEQSVTDELDHSSQLDDDQDSLSVDEGTGFSPTTLDASFASSMSIGTAPPTPTPVPNSAHTNHSRHITSNTFLPAHLFAPNPNAMPPSSSPCRMDISPAPPSRQILIPTAQLQSSNGFQPHSSDDPFGGPSKGIAPQQLWTASPTTSEARRTIGLRKHPSRPKISPDSPGFFQPSRSLPERSSPYMTSVNDKMDIDSPMFAQRMTTEPFSAAPMSLDDQPVSGASDSSRQFAQRAARSGSQGSIGKRSRSDEDEEPESRPSTSGGVRRRSQTHSSSPAVGVAARDASRRPALVSRSTNSLFGATDHSFSSSPSQTNSPSVKAAAKITLGRKAGERSLSGFKFPACKASVTSVGGHLSARSQQYGMGSLGAASGCGAGVPRRPGLGVVQSSATLFSRYQSGATSSGMNKQRDATGRPASKSRRAISFAATEGDHKDLLAGAGLEQEEDDDDEELDASAALNCSPAPRTSTSHLVSNTWPKYGLSFSHHIQNASSICATDEAAAPRKRSPPPPALGLLAPPAQGGMMGLQSPIRSPIKSLMGTLGATIESPVGMGFSEKERAGKILPCHKVSNDGLMRISAETMDHLLEGVYDGSISNKIVIDCRFGYEYEGGHIRQAINVREKEMVEAMLLEGTMFRGGKGDVPLPSESGKIDIRGENKKVVVVFHCEYSAMRAPTVAKYLREKDRHLNMPHYPALHYPEVYILEGGYARYHAHSPQHCEGSYVRMDDPIYKVDRATDLNQFRSRESAVFSRAKSFTYGESRKSTQGAGMKKIPFLVGGRKPECLAVGGEGKENENMIEEEEEEEDDDEEGEQSFTGTKCFGGAKSANRLVNQGKSISMVVGGRADRGVLMVQKKSMLGGGHGRVQRIG